MRGGQTLSARRGALRVRRGLSLLALALAGNAAAAPTLNGFDLAGALVPPEDILLGGPPKNGIPAVDRPRFLPAAQAKFLAPDDRVLGMRRNGVAKAYPIAILNWHEIVNDEFGGEPVVVTFCPLCGSGMAFLATVGGKRLDFGVSGLLYNNDVLLYDRETQSLWSQLLTRAVTGKFKGTSLVPIPITQTTWGDWKKREPETRVLSRDTGYARDYATDPYRGYALSDELMFRIRHRSAVFHPKERVVGVEINGQSKAYPFVELAKTRGEIRDSVGGRPITIRFDRKHQTGAAFDAGGREIPSVTAYWFAWYAFHTDTAVFRAE